jgi:hypothetical protein
MQRKDFLASTDRAFRPVNMSVGPDSALCLLDMHREVIEPPEWIPDELEKNMNVAEWRDQAAVAPLENLFATSKFPQARLHALWALQGLKALPDSILLMAMQDSHAGVRENALIVAEEKLAENTEVLNAAAALAHDPEARVWMQTALMLSTIEHSSAAVQNALFAIAKQDAGDQWTRLALVAGAQRDPLALIRRLFTEEEWLACTGAKELLHELAQHVRK